MIKEDEKVLLEDLGTRMIHGVIVNTPKGDGYLGAINLTIFGHILGVNVNATKRENFPLDECKPYLRPMSSMTEEEKRELQSFYPGSFGNQWLDVEKGEIYIFECGSTIKLYLNDSVEIVAWLNAYHFDYRGLIEKGLALPAPKGMYNVKGE